VRETTERLAPGRSGTAEERVVDAMHRGAYAMLADFTQPSDRILEIGFGEGYGSALVASLVADYVGIEVEPAAVAHATEKYSRAGASFVHYDGSRIPFDDEAFDLAIAFQVIEHVEAADVLLREARRVVRPGGRVLVITPNRRHRVSDGERPWNRYHVREYTSSELADLMGSLFPRVELYGISGSATMSEIEKQRVAKARKLARLDVLGLRYHLPEGFDNRLRSVLRRRGGPPPAYPESEIGVEHVRRTNDQIEQSIDLLAVGFVG
jgi:ubiquinone/menaquinone biosynthesis C-methylase UbiE